MYIFNNIYFQSMPVLEEMFEIALNLSHSTRPQDSTTAAYLFSVLTHLPGIHKMLTQHVEVVPILNKCAIPGSVGGKSENVASKLTETEAVNENQSATGSNNQSEAGKNGAESTVIEPKVPLLYGTGNNKENGHYLLLSILYQSLEAQCQTAKTSLAVAAANKPLYPTIQCMRYCFSSVDFG